ncbi:hypothetical protein M0804_015542, partial [Polistes exclamans]
VKCAKNHLTALCPHEGKIEKVICVNCNGNHPANYKGCQMRKLLQQKLYPTLRKKVLEKPYQNVPYEKTYYNKQNTNSNRDNTPIVELNEPRKTYAESKPLLYKKSPTLCNGSTNWMIFKETLESKLNCNIPLKTSSQIDNAVNNLTDAIQEAAWASTSQKVTSRDFPTYPSNILHKIKIKRQVKARWQKNQTKSNKRLLNKVTKDVKQSLRDYNNAEFEKYIT